MVREIESKIDQERKIYVERNLKKRQNVRSVGEDISQVESRTNLG